MRIIAGQFRGRRLQALAGHAVRPTSDKLRETLFNILAPWIEETVFLDCYAGTGAVGIEALSRGAREAYLIESDAAAVRVIEQNISWLEPRDQLHIRRGTVERTLPALAAAGVRADICFLDPPYAKLADAIAVIKTLPTSTLLKPDGWIILEHASRDATPEAIGTQDISSQTGGSDTSGSATHRWPRTRLLKQGDSALSFYRLIQETRAE